MTPAWRRARAISLAIVLAASCLTGAAGKHVLLEKVLSDNPPPGQSDASCAHLVRAGLDEGVDSRGRPIVEPEVHHLTKAMRKMWWECAAAVANALAKYGSEVEDAFQMEQRSITKQLNEIKSALQRGKPVQSIAPAFEWAQSSDWIYINAKMSHKLDAPATLNVVSEGVEMQGRSLKFTASKDHKRFSLDLDLHAEIDPDPSSTSWGSVGRVTFTLKKSEGGVIWPTLLQEGQKKPVNMHVWWSKQEEYADEIEALEDAAAEASIKAAKAAKADAAGTSAERGEDKKAGSGAQNEDDGDAVHSIDSEKEPTSEELLAKAKKDASAALNREKRARLEELDKDKRAAIKSVDDDARAKKKSAEEALRARQAHVDEEFAELLKKKHEEIEAAHSSGARNEL